MLRALSADERRVVLAHEAAHLARHHHLYVQLADLAAAANPLLRSTARGVRLAVEREADEVAAAEVGDRRLVARDSPGRVWPRPGRRRDALAKAWPSRRRMASSLSARSSPSPAPRPRRMLAAGLVLLAGVTLVGTAAAAQQTDDNLDDAQRAPAVTVVY